MYAVNYFSATHSRALHPSDSPPQRDGSSCPSRARKRAQKSMPASPASRASEDEKTVFEMLIMSVCCLSSIVCDCLFMLAQRRSDCDSITPAPVPVLSFVHVLVAVIASLSSSLYTLIPSYKFMSFLRDFI